MSQRFRNVRVLTNWAKSSACERSVLLAVILFAQLGNPVFAADNANFNLGRTAYEAKDYATAYTYWEKGAQENSPEALRWLGILYSKGNGVERNDQKALELYEKALNQGDKDAAYALAYKYREMKDYANAKTWYLKVIEQDDLNPTNALLELAEMYERGEGVSQDYERAFMLTLRTANSTGKGPYNLGRLYLHGIGVGKNEAMAYKWLKSASAVSYAPAKEALAKFDAPPSLSEATVAKWVEAEALATTDKAKAFPLMLEAAEMGHWRAMIPVAEAYLNGVGVPQDDVKARMWYKKAAEFEVPEAIKAYADMLREGKGGPASGEYAKIWYTRAVQLAHWPALYELGVLNDGNYGVPKNPEKAAYWYRRSASTGNVQAKQVLADRGLPEKIAKPVTQTATTADPISEYNKQQAFIDRINKYGPSTESISAYSYDVAVYCSWGGQRCREFQSKQNSLINQNNRNAASQNSQRLWNVYGNGGSQGQRSSSGFSYTQQTTDRYNQTVRRSEEQRKMNQYKQELNQKIYGRRY